MSSPSNGAGPRRHKIVRPTFPRRRRIVVVGATLTTLLTVILAGCSTVTKTEVPPLPQKSQAQLDKMAQTARQGIYDTFEESFQQPLPEVAMVRYVRPREQGETLLRCVRDAGFSASLDSDGGLSPDKVEGEVLQFSEALATCRLQYPVNPKWEVTYSKAEINYMYSYFVGDLSRCLSRNGYDITGKPSSQRFAETWDTKDNWSPYQQLINVDQATWYRLKAKCPEMPHGFRGY